MSGHPDSEHRIVADSKSNLLTGVIISAYGKFFPVIQISNLVTHQSLLLTIFGDGFALLDGLVSRCSGM
jgi:hypothetical protein